ncbi:uncharacterized protein BO80DRAFT_412501 [Aspergillus ibericus CBS 121593]|uniref:LysM domain-containing protein n=1 Tax=Aspergillus ibericus CBS 121593 TaxID=1448316 RepID=A0A395GSK1_9EURO|nr:hypothetical protein BO80DRAFT_412501 [Aspergillus ibericus CBS 121593]RAK98561.1 hypothetical protein BO80DRAFT_412501 [Aspergillus ibericus CBS 121593]
MMPTPWQHFHARAMALLSLAALTPLSQGYQLFDTAPTSLPAACGNALAVNISCDQLFSASYIAGGGYVSVAALDDVCSTNCTNSLLSFQADVDAACGNTTYTFPGNVSQTVQNFVDPLVWALEAACITSQSTYCLPAVVAGNVSACSPCMYQYEAAMLDSPYGQVRYSPDTYSSLLSSCGVAASNYPFTDTAVATVVPSATATVSAMATATCSSYYTVESGDTCQSIATAHSISTARFVIDNNLSTLNCSVQVGQQVCLGAECALYQVQANDTCASILQNQTFYRVQLTSWNPTLWTDCGNLDSMVGEFICISPPGTSSWVTPSTNITTSWNVSWVIPPTAFTTLPAQPSTFPVFNTSAIAWPVTTIIPAVQNVTWNETLVPLFVNLTQYCPITEDDYSNGWTISDLPESCEDLLDEYCDPPANATMPASTVLPATCSPAYYTVSGTTATGSSTSASTAPEQTGIAANCDAYYVVQKNDTCASIVAAFGNFTLTQFYSWNPAVGSSCADLDAGYAVCIGTTSSTSASSQTGTATTTTLSGTLEPSTDPQCTKYHKVVEGDNCVSIEAEYDITAAEFLAWNPTVGATCESLWLGYLVCVDAPYTTTSSATPAATSTSTATSTVTSSVPAVEPSTVADCTEYHLVVDGDDCETIEAQYDITAAEFNEWNPYVGTGCESLWLGYYVCVDAPSS